MIRAITFIPASSGTEGLTYAERASRHRSLHVLLQDCTFQGAAATHSPSRRNFLRNAYREIIARYVSFGRIEHPLPLARSLVAYLETLCKRVDCRLDDFRGIGFYALFQDGETFYLLTSREGRARIRTERGFEPLGGTEIAGVTELPIETTLAQTELFSQDLKDFLALYKVEWGRGSGESSLSPLDISLGGSGEEMDTLIEALDQPGVIETGVTEKTIPLNLISDKMLFVRFDGLIRTREWYQPGRRAADSRRRSRRSISVGFPVAAALAVATLGGLWLSDRLAGPSSETSPTVAQSAPPQAPEGAARETAGVPPGADSADDHDVEPRFAFSVAWDKSYRQPVTSSPTLGGGKVFFGSRDRHLYALDREDGSVAWRYRASGGVGASPAFFDGRVVAADYGGNVFAVGSDDGKLVWNRKLPGKVVSSPCRGGTQVVVGCYDGSAYALSWETGRVAWRLKTGGRIRGSCAFADGTFLIPSYDGNLYAVIAGDVSWKARLGGQIDSSPAVEGDRVVVGAANGGIFGLSASDGRVVWRYQSGAAVKSFAAAFGGKAYVGSNDQSLYCLDMSSGDLLWKFETGGPVLGRAAGAGNHVLFPSYDGYVYCLDAATGARVDRFQTGGSVFSSPVISDGFAFFGNNEGKFYCLNTRGGESS